MITQSDTFGETNFWPEARSNTQQYLRWDAPVKQNLPWYRLRVFVHLNNIDGARDTQINQGANFRRAEGFYGMTADAGIRLQL